VTFSRLGIAAVLWLTAGSLAEAQEYVVSPYAGGAPALTPIAGVTASIGQPYGVATGAAGNIYFSSDNCVFMLDANGLLTRVAGKYTLAGYSGDGGPATDAQLHDPTGVAVDRAGNLYIADSGNNRIRKVSSAGIITTIAGNGAQGDSGDGGPALRAELWLPSGVAVDSTGHVFVADTSNNAVRLLTPHLPALRRRVFLDDR
jgi:sugar lactone lactonase YvrE